MFNIDAEMCVIPQENRGQCFVLRGGVSQLNVGAEWTVGAGSAGKRLKASLREAL